MVKKVFSKAESTKWSHDFNGITEIIHDTIPSYKLHYLLERYIESILESSKLTFEENNRV